MPDNQINNDLDSMLDMDPFSSFNIPDDEPGGRKPSKAKQFVVKNLLTSVKGFTRGAANAVEASFPSTSGLISGVVGEASSIMDTVKDVEKDLKPTVNSVKRALHKSLPMAKEFIPQDVYKLLDDKLKGWESETVHGSKTQAQMQDEAIQFALAEVFGLQEQIRRGERQDTIAQQMIDRVLTTKRHRDELGALRSIDNRLLHSLEFQTISQTAWMKKMLELQYIGVHTAKEHLGVAKVVAEVLEKKLEGIRHNTSLPDVAKASIADTGKEIKRRIGSRALTKIGDQFSKGGVIGGIGDRVKSAITGKVTSGLRGLKSQADQIGDMADMAASVGMSVSDLSDDENWLLKKMSESAGTFAGRRGLDKITPVVDEIEGASSNIQDTLFFKLSKLGEKLDRSDTTVMRLLGSVLPRHFEQRSITNTLLDDPTGPVGFDVATRQAIVEVIPGYLSTMDKSLRDLVTGSDTEQRVFDPISRTIIGMGDAKESAMTRAFGDRTSRSNLSLVSTGLVKGALTTKAGEAGDELFESVKKDVHKFIANSVTRKKFIDAEAVKEYAESGIEDPERFFGSNGSYIRQTFSGLSNPMQTAQALVAALYTGDDIDTTVMREFESTMTRAMKAENWKTIIPNFLDAHGAWGIFRDMGALDDSNRITDEFLNKTMLDVDDDEFDARVQSGASIAKYRYDTRQRQMENMRLGDAWLADDDHDDIQNLVKAIQLAKAENQPELAAQLTEQYTKLLSITDPSVSRKVIQQLSRLPLEKFGIIGKNIKEMLAGTYTTPIVPGMDIKDINIPTTESVGASGGPRPIPFIPNVKRIKKMQPVTAASAQQSVTFDTTSTFAPTTDITSVMSDSAPMSKSLYDELFDFHYSFLDYDKYVRSFNSELLDIINDRFLPSDTTTTGSDEVTNVQVLNEDDPHHPLFKRIDTIITLLQDRLPEQKSVLGDITGDGIRDGSYEDQMRAAQGQMDLSGLAGLLPAAGGAGAAMRPSGPGMMSQLVDAGQTGGAGGVVDSVLTQYLPGYHYGKSAWGAGKALLGKLGGGKAALAGAKALAGKGAALAAGTIAPAAALAHGAYTTTDRFLDDDVRAERLADIEDAREKLGIFGGGPMGHVLGSFGVHNIADNFREKGLLGGAGESLKGLFKGTGNLIGDIGTAAGETKALVKDIDGNEEVVQLEKALVKSGIVKDPIGWGKWRVLDWDKLKRLSVRDLRNLSTSNKFSEEDIAVIRRLALSKFRSTMRDREDSETIAAGVSPHDVIDVSETAAADKPSKSPSDADTAAQIAEMREFEHESKSAIELERLRSDMAKSQAELTKVMSVLTVHMEHVASNTGQLTDIKGDLNKNLKEATKPTQVVVQAPAADTRPKIDRSAINVSKQY